MVIKLALFSGFNSAEKNFKIFKRKLRIIVEQQMAVVDEIETLDLKED